MDSIIPFLHPIVGDNQPTRHLHGSFLGRTDTRLVVRDLQSAGAVVEVRIILGNRLDSGAFHTAVILRRG